MIISNNYNSNFYQFIIADNQNIYYIFWNIKEEIEY